MTTGGWKSCARKCAPVYGMTTGGWKACRPKVGTGFGMTTGRLEILPPESAHRFRDDDRRLESLPPESGLRFRDNGRRLESLPPESGHRYRENGGRRGRSPCCEVPDAFSQMLQNPRELPLRAIHIVRVANIPPPSHAIGSQETNGTVCNHESSARDPLRADRGNGRSQTDRTICALPGCYAPANRCNQGSNVESLALLPGRGTISGRTPRCPPWPVAPYGSHSPGGPRPAGHIAAPCPRAGALMAEKMDEGRGSAP